MQDYYDVLMRKPRPFYRSPSWWVGFIAMLTLAFAPSCITSWADVQPVTPTPINPTPVTPTPQPPVEGAVPYAKVQQLDDGMDVSDVEELLGKSKWQFPRSDTTLDLSWPAVGPKGERRRLEVRFVDGAYVSHVLY